MHSTTYSDPRRGSRHERGYGSAWDRLRPQILARDAGLCQVHAQRGQIAPGNIVDHIVNKASGGTDAPANLRCICAECHAAKTAHEALAARGLTARPSASCTAQGQPTDPAHPWNQMGRGG